MSIPERTGRTLRATLPLRANHLHLKGPDHMTQPLTTQQLDEGEPYRDDVRELLDTAGWHETAEDGVVAANGALWAETNAALDSGIDAPDKAWSVAFDSDVPAPIIVAAALAAAGTDVPALLAEVRRLQRQNRFLLAALAAKDARTGDADHRLREFFASPDDKTDADDITGSRPCGHDDYHDPHAWHERPGLWCPGISTADDEPAARPVAASEDTVHACPPDGSGLTPAEAYLLRERVETEIREHDTIRAVAAGNKRHVQYLYGEFEKAQAAIERGRALARYVLDRTTPGTDDWQDGQRELAQSVLDALDGTEQPATTEDGLL